MWYSVRETLKIPDISVVLAPSFYRIVIAVVLYLGMPPNVETVHGSFGRDVFSPYRCVKAKWDSRMVGCRC